MAAISQHYKCTYLLFVFFYIQSPVKLEHFDAAMVHASSSLTAVMGVWIALMAVMRLDAVGVTYCGYLGV